MKKLAALIMRQVKVLLGVCILFMLPFPVKAQILPFTLQPSITKKPTDKAEQSVLQKAQSGIAQDVYVEFEHKEILDKADEERRRKKLVLNDDETENDIRRRFKTLRENVFPGGKFEAATVIRASDVVPTAKVHVPNSEALQRILNHPKVKAVYGEQNYVPHLNESLPLIGQPGVKSSGKIGSGTTVAILDASIIPANFNCRAPNESNGLPLIGTNGCRISIYNYFGPLVPYSAQWINSTHGTNVTGIVEGVAPGTTLAFLQVFYLMDGKLTGNFDTLSKAMEWIIANAKTYNIKAANFSLGSTDPFASTACYGSRFVTYFNRLRDAGVIPVAATGNNGDKAKLPEPACAPNVVSVGSVYDQDISRVLDCTTPAIYSVKTYDVPCSSNSNSTVKLLAPGHGIEARNTFWAGTSQAAPHVSGAIAVLRAPNAFPNEDLDTTILRMTSTGKKIVDKWNGVTTPFLDLGSAFLHVPVPITYPSAAIQTIINSVLTTE